MLSRRGAFQVREMAMACWTSRRVTGVGAMSESSQAVTPHSFVWCGERQSLIWQVERRIGQPKLWWALVPWIVGWTVRDKGRPLTFLKALHMSVSEVILQNSLKQRHFATMIAFQRAHLFVLKAQRSSGVKVWFLRCQAWRWAFRSSERWGTTVDS